MDVYRHPVTLYVDYFYFKKAINFPKSELKKFKEQKKTCLQTTRKKMKKKSKSIENKKRRIRQVKEGGCLYRNGKVDALTYFRCILIITQRFSLRNESFLFLSIERDDDNVLCNFGDLFFCKLIDHTWVFNG